MDGAQAVAAVAPLATAVSAFFRRQLVSNALSLYVVQGLNYLVPLLVLPFLLRALGPRDYGAILLAQSLMGYALILTTFGFNFSAARDISVARRDPQAVAKVYWTTMAAKGALLLASCGVLAVIVTAVPAFREHWRVCAACSLLVLGDVLFPQWYLQGLERLKEAALAQAISRLAVAAAIILMVRSPGDMLLAAALSSAPQLLAVFVSRALGRPLAPAAFYRPSLADVSGALKRSWHIFASSVSTTLYLNTNTFVLGLMCGTPAVAEYGLANRLISVLQGIATPISQAVFPRASLLFAERRAEAWALLARVTRLVLPIIALASLCVGVFAPEIVRVLGGEAYAGAATAVRIMMINPVLIAAAGIPAQTIMVNTGLTKQMMRAYLAAGIVNLAVLPFLVSAYAASGAALSLAIAETVACTLLAAAIWRQRR